MCSLFQKKKQTKNNKKIKRNYIVPQPTFTTDEVILCNGCNQQFSLESKQIQIHCAGCNQFYHCKIAGTCYGKNCTENINGEIHHQSWCINCVPGISENKIVKSNDGLRKN